MYRKVLIVTLGFLAAELIKEIALTSLNRIPFTSFWFYFGFAIVCLITLFLTYKWRARLQLVNIVLITFLCIFYSFSYYYIDIIEFSFSMTVITYLFSLRGIYFRFCILVTSFFIILDINLIYSNFNKGNITDTDTILIENRTAYTIPFSATL